MGRQDYNLILHRGTQTLYTENWNVAGVTLRYLTAFGRIIILHIQQMADCPNSVLGK